MFFECHVPFSLVFSERNSVVSLVFSVFECHVPLNTEAPGPKRTNSNKKWGRILRIMSLWQCVWIMCGARPRVRARIRVNWSSGTNWSEYPADHVTMTVLCVWIMCGARAWIRARIRVNPSSCTAEIRNEGGSLVFTRLRRQSRIFCQCLFLLVCISFSIYFF